MTYASVCSGIEAASAAWLPLGWECAFVSEIDRPASDILRYHHPETPNHGDLNQYREWPDAAFDVLIGGTPCQAFSVAGLRKGLADPRGNLTLVFLGLVARYRPTWVLWENVPGVLSIDSGRTFGSFLGGLGELGYGFAYRVLDAQHFGVAQRRRRVFVVAHAGDWRRAAAVLFERESLSGHPAPRRGEGTGFAGSVGDGVAGSLDTDGGAQRGLRQRAYAGHQVPSVTAIDMQGGKGQARTSSERSPTLGASGEAHAVIMASSQANAEIVRDGSPSLTCQHDGPPILAFSGGNSEGSHGIGLTVDGTPPLRAGPSGTNQVPTIAFSSKDSGQDAGEVAPTLRAMPHDGSHANGGGQVAIAFTNRGAETDGSAETLRAQSHGALPMVATDGRTYQGDRVFSDEEVWPTLPAQGANNGGGAGAILHRPEGMQVRRLTPRECERLQGFPDDHTKHARREDGTVYTQADSQRYKQLGNSMAVPVIRWLGERIALVDSL